MAKLPKQKKILPDQFPKQDFMPELLTPLNSFMDDVTSALNKSLTFKENIAGEVLTVTIDGIYPIDVLWTNKSRPVAAWLGYCRELSGVHTNFTDPLFLDWEMAANDKFRINNITGLAASNTHKYQVVIIAING